MIRHDGLFAEPVLSNYFPCVCHFFLVLIVILQFWNTPPKTVNCEGCKTLYSTGRYFYRKKKKINNNIIKGRHWYNLNVGRKKYRQRKRIRAYIFCAAGKRLEYFDIRDLNGDITNKGRKTCVCLNQNRGSQKIKIGAKTPLRRRKVKERNDKSWGVGNRWVLGLVFSQTRKLLPHKKILPKRHLRRGPLHTSGSCRVVGLRAETGSTGIRWMAEFST